jgi:hypothetical protein
VGALHRSNGVPLPERRQTAAPCRLALVILFFAADLKLLRCEFIYLFDERSQSWGHLLVHAIIVSHQLSDSLSGESPAKALIP